MKSKNQKSPKNKDHTNQMPEKKGSKQPRSDNPLDLELEQQQSGNDTASYSEEHDVTPPKPHGFPSFGNPETDFVSRDHGRRTSRMLDDEPGI